MRQFEETEYIKKSKGLLFLKRGGAVVGIVEILKPVANVDIPESLVEQLPKTKDLHVYTALYNKPLAGESSNKSYYIVKKLQPKKKHVGFLYKQDFLDFLSKEAGGENQHTKENGSLRNQSEADRKRKEEPT
jgi:hypothetical protein